MIIVVGDLHGDWGKLNALMSKKHPEIVLQCGDFGWWPQMDIKPVLYGMQKEWKLRGVKPGDSLVYWCDGNHENHWDLEKFTEPTEVYDGVNYMPRGTTLTLPDGRVVLFIGGADSVDKGYRTLGIDWYPEELIRDVDLDRALSHARVDIVISHTCPAEFDIRGYSDDKIGDPSRVALSRVLERYKPALWYFGHWHVNKEGKFGDTRWTALNYPGHGGRWWVELK